eukprot:GHVS01012761.1.p1 GENE.GHVS01012761.1~~GHVS01012761.1.p1  ORF type:complete len:712 (+),score=156.94 GHVS01012761.1:27-2138(+)
MQSPSRFLSLLSSCYHRLSPASLNAYFLGVTSNYGLPFTLTLISVYAGVKGCMFGLIKAVQLPYYKALGIDGTIYQVNCTVAQTPWAMKGLIGAVSDLQPIAGYHKKWYMILATLLGLVGLVLLLLLPDSLAAESSWLPALLFTAVQAQVATVDLLSEGKYVEWMSKLPHTKGDVVTFVWLCVGLGSFVTVLFVGPVTQYFGAKPIFALCLPVSLQLLYPLFRNWLPEDPLPPSEANRFLTSKLKGQFPVFLLAMLIALLAMVIAVVSITGDLFWQFAIGAVASLLLCVLGLLCLPRVLALCNIYMFLQDALYVNVGGALEYFYLADGDCVVGGPNFDYTYYYTYVAIVGMVAHGAGLWLFQTVLSGWKFRRVFWITSLIRVAASTVDLVLVNRLNLALGIPDRWTYLLGHAIVFNVCTTMNFLPSVILTCRMCPKHLESTVYSILAGYANFGYIISNLLGVVGMKFMDIKSKPPCDFSGLSTLVVWCHGIFPLLCIPLTFLLIPDAFMDESLTKEMPTLCVSPSSGDTPTGPDTPTGETEEERGSGRPSRGIGRKQRNRWQPLRRRDDEEEGRGGGGGGGGDHNQLEMVVGKKASMRMKKSSPTPDQRMEAGGEEQRAGNRGGSGGGGDGSSDESNSEGEEENNKEFASFEDRMRQMVGKPRRNSSSSSSSSVSGNWKRSGSEEEEEEDQPYGSGGVIGKPR